MQDDEKLEKTKMLMALVGSKQARWCIECGKRLSEESGRQIYLVVCNSCGDNRMEWYRKYSKEFYKLVKSVDRQIKGKDS